MKIYKYMICGAIAIAVCNLGLSSFAAADNPDDIQYTLEESVVSPQPMDSFSFSATYEIILNANGGHFVPMTGNLTITTADNATLDGDLPTPVREGYHFDGWYTLPYGENGKITNKTVFTRDTMIYAHWTEDPNYSPVMSAASLTSSESEDSSTQSEDASTSEVSKDYTITFDANGGKPEHQTLITSNNQLIILPTATREGYRFVGWSVQKDSNEIISTDFVFSQDTTLYAQWQEVTYADCYGDWLCPIHKYTDSNPRSWYHDGMHYMLQHQFMIGIDEHTFQPNAALTRGMIVQILYNQAGSPEITGTVPFWDVSGNEWYYSALVWAYNKGVVLGYGTGRFAADTPITREQLAQMLYANSDWPASEGYLEFPDWESISSWAIEAMVWANQNHMMDGREDNGMVVLDPEGSATRAESSVILMKYKLMSEQQ